MDSEGILQKSTGTVLEQCYKLHCEMIESLEKKLPIMQRSLEDLKKAKAKEEEELLKLGILK